MKIAISLLVALILLLPAAELQSKDLGNMLGQIADGLKPEAFTDEFKADMEAWVKHSSALASNDLTQSKEQVAALINGLNNDAIDSGTKEQLKGILASASNISDVADVLSTLIEGIDPLLMTSTLASDMDSMLEGLAGI